MNEYADLAGSVAGQAWCFAAAAHSATLCRVLRCGERLWREADEDVPHAGAFAGRAADDRASRIRAGLAAEKARPSATAATTAAGAAAAICSGGRWRCVLTERLRATF